MRVAVLDACVLYQGMLTDLLLRICQEGVFEPIWSDDIHAEWMHNLEKRIPADKVEYRRTRMDDAFKAASVPGQRAIIATIRATAMNGGQRKDAHVVATAVAAKADTIVTHNIPDFHVPTLQGYGLRKMRPDAFFLELLGTHQARVLAGVKAHRASLLRNSPTLDEYLKELAGPKVVAPRFAKALEAHKASI
jgi:predicted nucleic acid-binding protein